MIKEYSVPLIICALFLFLCGTLVGGCQEKMMHNRVISAQKSNIPDPDEPPKFDFGDNVYYKIYTDRPQTVISDAYWRLNRHSHKYEWHYVTISEICGDKWKINGETVTQRFGLIPERDLTRCD